MKRKINKQGKIEWLEIFIWIVILILFGMILSRMFGKSATDVQIYIGFITSLVAIVLFMAKHYRETGEIKINMRHGFNKVREDIKRLENKIDGLNKRGKK